MHPALMGKKQSTMIIMGGSPSMELEMEPEKDPFMEVIECMRKKDMPGCLRALADYFAKESAETDGY